MIFFNDLFRKIAILFDIVNTDMYMVSMVVWVVTEASSPPR